VIARTSGGGDAQALIEPLRRVTGRLDPDVPLQDASTVSSAIEQSMQPFDLLVQLLSGFAILGLFLAALGIYSVIAQSVAQRTAEIGIRMALGAQLRDILWLVLASGVRLSLLGIALGLLGALALGRVMHSILPEMRAPTLAVNVLVTLALLTVALVACYIPARRANRVDPMVALRND
jgi:putative ABC transport system permease protein